MSAVVHCTVVTATIYISVNTVVMATVTVFLLQTGSTTVVTLFIALQRARAVVKFSDVYSTV